MSNDKTMTTQEARQQALSARQAPIRPAVDIFEDKEGITILADMPGVSKDRLDIHVADNVLNIEGSIEIPMPQDMSAIYADIRSTRYARSFALSNELDQEKIDAELKDGVLTLRIPKRAELMPRRIEVRAG